MHRSLRPALLGCVAFVLTGALPATLNAQAASGVEVVPLTSSKPAADTPGLSLTPDRALSFTTKEGTWMSPDLSPDGKRIAFELLGDIYLVDAKGGQARAILTGMGFDTQAVFSPNGKQIAFVSDRSGTENLWISDTEGKTLRAVTTIDEECVLTSPAWSADGRTLFVSRYRVEQGGFDMLSVDVASGKVTVIVAASGSPTVSTVGAAASKDGQWLYYASQVGPHNIDPTGWVIRRRHLATGKEETIVSPPASYRPDLVLGTFYRPLPSPDGKALAYATRNGAQMWIKLLDLETREDRWLVPLAQRDGLAGSPSRDLAPHYAFTPDSQSLIVNDGGKLKSVKLATRSASDIPFSAKVRLPLAPRRDTAIAEETGPVRARIIQHPMQSPDGTQLTFSALGRIYVMPLDGKATPRLLTDGPIGEYEPSWSADGRSILFVRWTARDGGHIWRAPSGGGGAPQKLSDIAAYYTSPVETPDGRSVLAIRSSHSVRMHRYMEYGPFRDAELIAVSSSGGAAKVITTGNMGGIPHFGADRDKVAVLFDNGLNLVSLGDGKRDLLVQVTGPGYYFLPMRVPVDDLRLSPDGSKVLAQITQQLYVLDVPSNPGTTIDIAAPGVRSRRLTDVGADFLQWSPDGQTIGWGLGSTWFRRALAEVQFAPADNATSMPDLGTPKRNEAIIEVPRAKALGTLLLRGATVLAVPGIQTIDNADILIKDGRFVAVGTRGTVPLPDGVEIQDVSGKWIVPGFIDDHDHVADIRRGVLDLESWGPAANLAYGVTTAFDPSTLSIDMLPYQDLLDAGLMTGSRIRSTGPAVFSFNEFKSKSEVDHVLDRYRDYYRLTNLKLYRTGSRQVRQWVIQSAHERGLRVTAEGASADKLNLTQIQDGVGGIEHALPSAPLYQDVVNLFARSGVFHNLTLMVNGGGQDRYIVESRANRDPKLNRFTPRFIVDMKTRKRDWRVPEDDAYPAYAESGARILRAGGTVGMGSHGEVPGLGFHWEMQAHVDGGWTPSEALYAATMGSAKAIGRWQDLGSIEAGKVADLVILAKDPRQEIRNAEVITQVMQGGRLFEATTLNQVWPVKRDLPRPWHWDANAPDTASSAITATNATHSAHGEGPYFCGGH